MSSLIAYDSRHIQALAAVATLSLCLPPPGIDKSMKQPHLQCLTSRTSLVGLRFDDGCSCHLHPLFRPSSSPAPPLHRCVRSHPRIIFS